MTTTPAKADPAAAAFELDRSTVLHLAADLHMKALQVDERTWSEPGALAQFAEGRLLSVFDYEVTWTWWERHPDGEELVHVLTGSIEFRLDDGSQETAVSLAEGQSLLVPEGTWHSADVVEPARVLFVTPTPACTEHRSRTGRGR